MNEDLVQLRAHVYPILGHIHVVITASYRDEEGQPLRHVQLYVGDGGELWDSAHLAACLSALSQAAGEALDREMT